MKTSQVWKECRLLRFVNCFCPFLQLQVSDFLIFLSAFGLFWVFWPSEGCFLTFFASLMPAALRSAKKVKKRPSSGQKSQKRAQADKKIKKSSTFSCKKGQKQLTHHKKSLHSFHTSEFSYLRMEFHETFHFLLFLVIFFSSWVARDETYISTVW